MTLLHGDCRDTLKTIASGTVQCCVTSPPYWGLRSYLPKGHDDKHLEIGQEKTPELYVETMVQVFREVRRCLHESGTVWLNIGDSYAAARGGTAMPAETLSGGVSGHGDIVAKRGRESDYVAHRDPASHGLKHKDLCMIPWRVALALQADGWWVRSVICWHKKSCMPESVTDRPTNSWEPIFLLAKSQRYFYDAEAVKEPITESSVERSAYGWNGRTDDNSNGARTGSSFKRMAQSGEGMATIPESGLRNQRNVWSLSPEPFSGSHFAVFPTEIPRRAILAGTSARGCCPKCRAPWVRQLETKPMVIARSDRADKTGCRTNPSGTMVSPSETRTVGWEPGCECDGIDRRIVASPTGGRNGDDPSLVTGRAGMNRPRGDNEGQRPITRYEQTQYAAQLKASPHRKNIEARAGSAFAHYIRTDDNGARPIPDQLLREWIERGWLTRVNVPDVVEGFTPKPCTVLDPFGGSGTTGAVAIELGRHAILCELNEDYLPLIEKRTHVTKGLVLA